MYRSAVFPGDDVDRDRSASPSSPCIIQCSIRAHVGIGGRMHGREVRRRRRTQADKQRDGGVRESALSRGPTFGIAVDAVLVVLVPQHLRQECLALILDLLAPLFLQPRHFSLVAWASFVALLERCTNSTPNPPVSPGGVLY